jgi:hypothetical protein
MLLLLIFVCDWKAKGQGSLQQYNILTNFHTNRSIDSKFEREDTQTAWWSRKIYFLNKKKSRPKCQTMSNNFWDIIMITLLIYAYSFRCRFPTYFLVSIKCDLDSTTGNIMICSEILSINGSKSRPNLGHD